MARRRGESWRRRRFLPDPVRPGGGAATGPPARRGQLRNALGDRAGSGKSVSPQRNSLMYLGRGRRSRTWRAAGICSAITLRYCRHMSPHTKRMPARTSAESAVKTRGREARLSRAPLPPNRAGGSPAHDSPVDGHIRAPLDSRAPVPGFSVLRPLLSGAMSRPPDKEAAWTWSNGIVEIGAGSPA